MSNGSGFLEIENKKANHDRLMLFLGVLLLSAVPMAFHLFYCFVAFVGWAQLGFPFHLSWKVKEIFPISFGPLAWALWFLLAIYWVYQHPLKRMTVLIGSILGCLSVWGAGLGAAIFTPAILLACYFCHWHWLSFAENSVRLPDR